MQAKDSAIEDIVALVLLAALMAASIAWPQAGVPLLLGISGLMVVFATVVLVQGHIGFRRWLLFALLAVVLALTVLAPKRWPATSHAVKVAWFAALVICAAASL